MTSLPLESPEDSPWSHFTRSNAHGGSSLSAMRLLAHQRGIFSFLSIQDMDSRTGVLALHCQEPLRTAGGRKCYAKTQLINCVLARLSSAILPHARRMTRPPRLCFSSQPKQTS